MENDLIEKARAIGRGYVYFVYADGSKEKRRLFISDGSICVIGKGRKRKGHHLTDEMGGYGFKNQLRDIVKFDEKPISEKWQHSINKAINLLEKSGLWVDVLNDLKTANAIGYEKISRAYEISNSDFEGLKYDEKQKEINKRIAEIDARLIGEAGHFKTEILWYMARPLKIKKMNFGTFNEIKLKEIAEGLKEKKKFSVCATANYDVSAEYSPDKNSAWYSEEFRNCGNGHYYLMLSDSHAVFWEDD